MFNCPDNYYKYEFRFMQFKNVIVKKKKPSIATPGKWNKFMKHLAYTISLSI